MLLVYGSKHSLLPRIYNHRFECKWFDVTKHCI